MVTGELETVAALSDIFTPTRPISFPNLLAGRLDILLGLLEDTRTHSQHVLLYGDRGVGKTSIAKVLGVLVEQDETRPMVPIFVSCDTTDTFTSLWRKVFREIPVSKPALGFGRKEELNIAWRLDEVSPLASPTDIRRLIDQISVPIAVIFDEYDRVQRMETRRLMTDAIKLFADSNTNCTVVLVGVGQTIEELVSAHQSISRNLDFVHVVPMKPDELAGIVRNGFEKANLRYDDRLDDKIARLSQGYPHYTHLLGLWSGFSAKQRESDTVTYDDLNKAIRDSLDRVDGSIKIEYQRATNSTQPNNLYKEVLLACALSEKDMVGGFSLASVREPLQTLLKRDIKPVRYQRHLASFCDVSHGPTLVKTGRPKNYRWHFKNPQLIPFVLLQGVEDGATNNDVAEIIGNQIEAIKL